MTLTSKEYSSNSTNEADSKPYLDDPKQLVQMHAIEDTPFTVVKYDNAWFVTMGKYRLSEPMPTRGMAEEDAKSSSWNRVMQVMQIMIENNNSNQPKQNLTT